SKKKTLIATAVVCVVLIAVFIIGITARSSASYRDITVFNAEGSVKIDRNGKIIDAAKNMKLKSGDEVAVGEDSFMRLCVDDDKFLYVDSNSELVITATGKKNNSRTIVEIAKGQVITEVRSKLNGDSSYEIVTPNTTMAIRGTIIANAVRVDANGVAISENIVLEGSALVGIYSETDAVSGMAGAGEGISFESIVDMEKFGEKIPSIENGSISMTELASKAESLGGKASTEIDMSGFANLFRNIVAYAGSDGLTDRLTEVLKEFGPADLFVTVVSDDESNQTTDENVDITPVAEITPAQEPAGTDIGNEGTTIVDNTENTDNNVVNGGLDETGSDNTDVPDDSAGNEDLATGSDENEVIEGTEEQGSAEVPDTTEEPEPTEIPDATEEPEPTEAPDATEEPEPTEVPAVTDEPEPTEAPVTDAPVPSEEPAATEAPEPTEEPVVTEVPKPTPEVLPTPEPVPSEEPTPVPVPTKEPEPTADPGNPTAPVTTPVVTPTEDPVITPTADPSVTPGTPEDSPTPTQDPNVGNDDTINISLEYDKADESIIETACDNLHLTGETTEVSGKNVFTFTYTKGDSQGLPTAVKTDESGGTYNLIWKLQDTEITYIPYDIDADMHLVAEWAFASGQIRVSFDVTNTSAVGITLKQPGGFTVVTGSGIYVCNVTNDTDSIVLPEFYQYKHRTNDNYAYDYLFYEANGFTASGWNGKMTSIDYRTYQELLGNASGAGSAADSLVLTPAFKTNEIDVIEVFIDDNAGDNDEIALFGNNEDKNEIYIIGASAQITKDAVFEVFNVLPDDTCEYKVRSLYYDYYIEYGGGHRMYPLYWKNCRNSGGLKIGTQSYDLYNGLNNTQYQKEPTMTQKVGNKLASWALIPVMIKQAGASVLVESTASGSAINVSSFGNSRISSKFTNTEFKVYIYDDTDYYNIRKLMIGTVSVKNSNTSDVSFVPSTECNGILSATLIPNTGQGAKKLDVIFTDPSDRNKYKFVFEQY
ncbi:MAG: FecR domain-containing protein, partial [Lachnospiraceae bacterium]|nr:FecR domain-containing protein [Lachnospiraceae bacterium]